MDSVRWNKKIEVTQKRRQEIVEHYLAKAARFEQQGLMAPAELAMKIAMRIDAGGYICAGQEEGVPK